MRIKIVGWRAGLQKISLNRLLREYNATFSLASTKQAVDAILDNKIVEFDLSDQLAREFSEKATQLGAIVELIQYPWSGPEGWAMNRPEDKLCDHLVFGATFTSKAEAQRTGYMPNLWEVCHDLERYIKEGSLIEIPVNCSLKEIFEAEKLKSKEDTFPNRILRQDYFDEDLIIHFKTVPGNALYELLFTKSERSALNGYLKKLTGAAALSR